MHASPKDAWTLRCDGGARGNPGPGACGFVLADASGTVVERRGDFLGTVTNNVAEYRGLMAGLEAAIARGCRALVVYMDSELVVRQMTGEYKVKHEGLKPLHTEARRLASKIGDARFVAVRREANAEADRLVNDVLDGHLGTESPR